MESRLDKEKFIPRTVAPASYEFDIRTARNMKILRHFLGKTTSHTFLKLLKGFGAPFAQIHITVVNVVIAFSVRVCDAV